VLLRLLRTQPHRRILIIVVASAVALGAASLAPHDPTACTPVHNDSAGLGAGRQAGYQRRSALPLGTDVEGRMSLSRAIYGLRPALVIGIRAPSPPQSWLTPRPDRRLRRGGRGAHRDERRAAHVLPAILMSSRSSIAY